MTAKKTEITYSPEELAEIERIVKIVTGETPAIPARDTRSTPRVKPADTTPPPVEDSFEDSLPSFEEEPVVKEEAPVNSAGLQPDEDIFPEGTEDIRDEEIEDITASLSDEIPDQGEEIIPLSDSDISFIDEDKPSGIEESADFDEFDEFEDITDHDERVPLPSKKSGDTISLESADDLDIPDLDQISAEDHIELPEASDNDIPEIDLDSIVSGEGPGEAKAGITDEDQFHDDISLDDIEYGSDETKTGKQSTIDEFDDFSDESFIEGAHEKPGTATDQHEEIPALDDFADIEPADIEHDIPSHEYTQEPPSHGEEETLTIEPLEDDFNAEEERPKPSGAASGKEKESSEVEVSDRDLAKLKKAIILFNPAVRQAIRDAIINDRLSPSDTKKLVDMIVTGKPEDNIQKFLEKKLKTTIILVDESGQKRRIISARPEYTLEGRERQKRLLKLTKIFTVSAIAAFLVMILSYQFIYKPYMAKRLINKGVELILGSTKSGQRLDAKKNYDEAEKLFSEVNDEYIENYLYGYNQYARAYLKNKDYQLAHQKLLEAYNIDKTSIDTLNNLGYFFAKIDRDRYQDYKMNVPKWYFGDKKDSVATETNLDLAINFYRRALLVDDENITAMVGIGNAYYMQGQYLKAKQYFEDILKVDPDSVAGYSGLLNLYIERDSFPLVGTLHAELREKEMLTELPSPLLAKLAGYYLDKRSKGDSNIRIDYGVTTPNLKDSDDNTYPAVLEVLKALNEKDPDYPPLHVQFAKFNQAHQNLEAMKRYLEKALELDDTYFGALHLMGVYHYMINDPVGAYEYLSKAEENFNRQPEFTQDDFYKETESRGENFFYMGNIFYYYFDKIKTRTGGLDDEIPDQEKEKMENYITAQKYYLAAYNAEFDSPELDYNLGRIYYLKGEYEFALERWLLLYDDFVQSPELMLPLGNAFYQTGKYDAAKGEFLKMIYVMEYEADKNNNPDFSKKANVKLYQSLATGYNNLGATYQMLQEYDKRDIAYWKAIEYSQRMGKENEYARTNLARSHRNAEPFIDNSIPFSIDYYLPEWRK